LDSFSLNHSQLSFSGGAAGSQNIPENNAPAPNIFAKKSPFSDNPPEPEFHQPMKPLENQDTNRTRKFANIIDEMSSKPVSQPSNNPQIQARDYPPQDHQPRGNFNQPVYSEHEPMVMNHNAGRRNNEEAMAGGARPNFNPTFQPSGGYEPIVRDSANYERADPKKKKADYGEELRNQMKKNEMKKQQEKNEVRNSQNLNQQQHNDANYFKEVEKRRKQEHGDYLKSQMQAKQDSRKHEELDRKAQLIQSLEHQEYNPFGRGGAGAPLRDAYGQRPMPMAQPNYLPPQQQQQQSYGRNPAYPPQQQQQQIPERLDMNNDPYAQRQAGYAMERAGSVEPIQRADTADYGRGNSMGNVEGMMPVYQRGNTMESGERGKRKGFQSEDPMEMAKKDKIKQDYQRGLQEQVEFKKRQKEMEKQRQLQEDRIEEERIRKEQEELARRQAEEDPKNKVMAKFKDMEKNANQLLQQQQQLAQEKPSRNRRNVQSLDQQANPTATANSDHNQFQSPPSNYPPPQQNQQPPPGYNQQPPPYYPPPYGHGYPPPYGQPYPQPYGYPPAQPYYNPQQQRNEAVTSELHHIRTEMQNQQAMLAKQLEIIKKEAMNVKDGRDKAEQELLFLREKLKDKIHHDEAYGKNLQNALERNNPNAPQVKAPRVNDSNPIRAVHRDPEPALEAYSYQSYQPKQNKPASNNNLGPSRTNVEKERNYEEFTFPATPDINKPSYDVRRTNHNMMDDPYSRPLDDSYMPALDIEKTLSGNTKMIPLAVFDNKQGMENTRSLDRDPLTLSKIHNFASSNLGQMHSNQKQNRPNSSKQPWQKDEDSIDYLIKAHGARPGSSESHGYGDTSHMIGRRLDEASELLRQVDVMHSGKGDRTNLRSRDKDTLSMAGRNILGDKAMNVGNYGGGKRGGGYPESERGSLVLRGDEGIKMTNHDLLPDLSMNSHQAMEHFNNPADNSMNMTGNSFNVDRIMLANEARLKKWDSVGGGSIRSDGSNYDKYGAGNGRGNYYNRGGLEAIQEDDDAHDNMAKIDKMLGGYLKTHEEIQGRESGMY